MGKINNLHNQRFGKLLVSDKFKVGKDRHTHWLCQCECGKKKYILSTSLTGGKTNSCGCLYQTSDKRGIHNLGRTQNKCPAWKGEGELASKYYTRTKNGAKVRKISFEITIKEMWMKFLEQQRKCALSGLDLTFDSKATTHDGNASLDRIDSTKGYTIDNIQWIHKDINFMKQELTDKYFIEMCKIIAEHNK